jgi:seryl-tRNA synthetase
MLEIYYCTVAHALQTALAEYEAAVAKLVPKIGNIVAPDVPTSDDEANNQTIKEHGPLPTGAHYLHHHEVLFRIGGYEPERGVQVAGHRGYFLRDNGLLLNQALIQFGLAFLVKRGYSVLQPPYFMNKVSVLCTLITAIDAAVGCCY